ncbi:MAG: methyl-accepting chemotaxis protein [Proteobacteria bacterium]|nr:MAG: methyl-accepting chemotaxis protein [Pseudomonadota bacterium]QKK10472.1 MAG: methyl-accepting chemotaxis protein [Pseudomonadota bacterium]
MSDHVGSQTFAAFFIAAAAGGVVAAVGASIGGGSVTLALVIGVVCAAVAFLVTYLMLAAPMGAGISYIQRLLDTDGNSIKDIQQPRSAAVASLVQEVGEFFTNHNELVIQMAEIGGGMAMAAAEVSFASDMLKKRVHSQVAHVSEIANAAGIISSTVQAAVESSAQSVETAQKTRRASYIGQEFIQDSTQKMEQMRTRVEAAAKLMSSLEARANQIKQITGVINDIADQTNLLALNAAIEAARAGDQGRGFAVVADEVRNLAKRTTAATTEIGQMVGEINEETGRAASTMHSLVDAVAESSEQTAKVDKQFEEVLEQARQVEQQIRVVAEGEEQNHAHLEQISGSIQTVSRHLADTESEVESVGRQALQLSDRAESLFEILGDTDLGTVHDQVRSIAQRAAAQIGKTFEQAVNSGRLTIDDLFDRNYRPIPGTDPQKSTTRFDGYTDEVLPAIQEPILAECTAITFAAAVDDRGYLPTHNRKFSQPLSGDYQKDLVNNRTKRIFNDRTGARCGSHTKPFLLQTYKRDTGEVMHDLSVPIFVNGRHWGGFRIGYLSR